MLTTDIDATTMTVVTPPDEVCRTFKHDMKSLYLLSLLLTADVHSAERCFASSLDDCVSLKPVFQHWTKYWTRRVVVQNAIAMLKPGIDGYGQHVLAECCNLELEPNLRAVMRLKNFERFVFVLSVLEGYSNHECSLLLGRPVRDIVAVKIGALQNLAINFTNKALPRTPR